MIKRQGVLIGLTFFIIGYSISYFYALLFSASEIKKSQKEPVKTTIAENFKTEGEFCFSRVSVGDMNRDGKNDFIIQCKDMVGYHLSFEGDDNLLGSDKLEDKQSFSDLFTFNGFDEYLQREVATFPKADPKFIVIKSIFYSGATYLEAFGIYRVNGKRIDRVFKSSFSDDGGRSKSIDFSDTEDEFEIISLTRPDINSWYKTIKMYRWNSSLNTFELINTQTSKE